VVAAKDAALDITVSWTPNVAFTEHEHVVEFSTNAGSSWSSLATVAGGTSTYKQVAPNPALIHVYRVRARNTDTGALTSAWVESNSVQLLAAPNAPTLAALPTNANKAADLVVTWTHNPVDTTPQTAYELEYSTNGGGSWTSSTKTTSTVSSYTIPASTHAANVTVTVRVRTWGQATTGGAETTGASDWSTTDAVTFKTIPVVTITAPADESVLDEAALNVVLGFSQAESATFVQATIVLTEGVTELESKVSTTLAGTLMDTEVEDDGSYSLSVTVLDSNGLTSAAVVSDFTVDFTPPATAGVVLTYDRDSGSTQIAVTIPAAGVGEVEAEFVTISRVIDGVRETLFTEYPVTVGAITFLDTTPTINGSNQYRVRTISGDGATADATVSLTTTETLWAFLSTGAGYGNYVSFGGDLTLSAKPARASALIPTAGRREPIALFGENTSRAVSGSTTLAADLGSTPAEVEAFMLEAGLVCYRDPSGRRVFGRLSGTVDTPSDLTSAFKFTVDEAS
jgi:methionine-rich copper-binding protein CopC